MSMSLIKCKECENLISNTATSCPKCGAKVKNPSGCFKLILIFIGVCVLFSVLSDLVNTEKKQREASDEQNRLAAMAPEQRAAYEQKKAEEAAAEAEAKEMDNARFASEMFVKKTLHDPDSAKFDDYRTYYAKRLKDGSYEVQVNVRAKNGFNALRYGTVDCRVKLIGKDWVALRIKQLN